MCKEIGIPISVTHRKPERRLKMAKPAVKRQTTDDLFNELSESVEATPQKSKGKKKEKPHIELVGSEGKAFDAFCAADNVYKMAEGKQKAAKSLVTPILRRKTLEKWIKEGRRTENPVVQTNSARANFVVRDILRIELPEHEDGTPGSVKERLLDAGFNEEEAEEIFQREFSERVETNFRSLNELRNGEPDEQKAVNKLLKLVLENFSPEERRLLLRKETKVEVNEGFLDRSVQHADGSVEKLDALLDVVSPQWVLSHMDYSGKDLRQAVADLTGGELPTDVEDSTKPEEFYSQDRQWKVVAKGAEASLYKVDGNEETLLGTKKCSGGVDHARMTCKKWLRDDGYRAKSIAEFIASKK
jgi:hypothetical protein